MGKRIIIKGSDFSNNCVASIPLIIIGSDCNTIILCENSVAIYYTTDGTIPTKSSTKYVGQFFAKPMSVVKSIAEFEDGSMSEIASSVNTNTPPIVFERTINYDDADVTGLTAISEYMRIWSPIELTSGSTYKFYIRATGIPTESYAANIHGVRLVETSSDKTGVDVIITTSENVIVEGDNTLSNSAVYEVETSNRYLMAIVMWPKKYTGYKPTMYLKVVRMS